MTRLAELVAAVAAYRDPILDRPLGDFGEIVSSERDCSRARVALRLGIPADRFGGDLVPALGEHLKAALGVDSLKLDLDWKVTPQPVQDDHHVEPGVRHGRRSVDRTFPGGKGLIIAVKAVIAVSQVVPGIRIGGIDP